EEKLLDKVLKGLPEAFDKLPLSDDEKKLAKLLLKKQPTQPETRREVVVTREYTIRGILRGAEESELRKRNAWVYQDVHVVLPVRTAEQLYYELPQQRERGFDTAIVEVDETENVKEVHEKIKGLGLWPRSQVERIDEEEFRYLIVLSAMTVVAVVALI